MKLRYYLLIFLFLPVLLRAKDTPGPAPVGMKTSLCFLANKGQVRDQAGGARDDIDFSMATAGMSLFIGSGQLHYQFNKCSAAEKRDALHLDSSGSGNAVKPVITYRVDVVLKGANTHAAGIAEDPTGYYETYYNGRAMDGIRASAYRKITYRNVYPNIDWVLYIRAGKLKYDFVLHPGADVNDIQLQYDGAELQLDKTGGLIAKTPLGNLTEHAPYSYWQRSGVEVSSGWQLEGNTLRFAIGAYPATETLIIDPELEWATYYGGNSNDQSNAVTTDPMGNVYIYGETISTNNIATTGSYMDTIDGGQDVFLAKFNATGTRLWATYYGGGSTYYGSWSNEYAGGLCADALGYIYLCGFTSGTEMATPGAHQPTLALTPGREYEAADAYLAKFDPGGNRLWCTYYGGNEGWEQGYSVSCDPGGHVYMAGQAERTIVNITPFDPNAIATPGSHQPAFSGGYREGFLVKFNSSGVRQWGTYYGGSGPGYYAVFDPPLGIDIANGVSCDPSGNVYLTGLTTSTINIATPGSHRSTFTFSLAVSYYPFDAFLAKFDSNGVRQWGTYYGGNNADYSYGVSCDRDGGIYIAGGTASPTGIATAGGFQNTLNGITDAFIAKFDAAGVRQWGSYYGGNEGELARGVSADTFGHVLLAGATTSNTGLATAGSYQNTIAGNSSVTPVTGEDAFLVRFDTAGTRLWATYYGGEKGEVQTSLACDGSGSAYITGYTSSRTAIATPGSHKDSISVSPLGSVYNFDAFLAKFSFCDQPHAGIIAGKTVFCPGDSLIVNAITGIGYRYQWQLNGTDIPGAIHPGYIADSSGIYTLVVSCPNTTLKDTVSIRLAEVPFSVRLRDTVICEGIPFRLQPLIAAPDSFSLEYWWSPAVGLDDPTQKAPRLEQPPGIYDYALSMRSLSPIVCVTSDTMTLEVYPAPSLSVSPLDTTIRYGDSIRIQAGGALYYVWWPSVVLDSSTIPAPMARPLVPTVYTVLGLSDKGCRDSATARVNIDYTMPDRLPNAFSPNGDGLNDAFCVAYLTYQKVLDFRVFNRWGQEVCHTQDAQKGWDGTVNGQPCDPGTYHYYIRLAHPDGKVNTYKGNVTLIR